MLRKNLDFLATLLFDAGVTHWAISPGSRNAPIVAGFIRHGGFILHSFPDERCASFAAMGMAQASGYTCGVICTSGTAVLNLYPGICEAFYQRIPLLVLTADRPNELIDQWDGQTIHQKNIFEKHILSSYETPQNIDAVDVSEELETLIFEAVETSLQPILGPVHINIPLRDPIYQGLNEDFNAAQPAKPFVFLKHKIEQIDRSYLHAELHKYSKILIVTGQMQTDAALKDAMRTVSLQYPVLADINANLNGESLKGWDAALLKQKDTENLKPELLITMGLSLVSKSLKQFLKKHKPQEHWHISAAGFVGDPFDSNPNIKLTDPLEFIEALSDITGINNEAYLNEWKSFTAMAAQLPFPEMDSERTLEMETVAALMHQLTENEVLHLGNSLTVRYASWQGNTDAQVWTNRGTSGIDGTLSTAVGFALANPSKKVYCILGDISFFYESNALWTGAIPANFGIVILNNYSGAIFDYIQGPRLEERLKPYIETPHQRHVKSVAEGYGVTYLKSNFKQLNQTLELTKSTTPFILDITHDNT